MAEIDGVVPKYLQISGHLRDLIERGDLAPGAEVPSERELAARWKVARPTAAKALNTLRQQGIVTSRRGSGTYVADRSALLRESAPRYGPAASEGDSVTVLEAEMVEGPREVTDSLGLPEASPVITLKLTSESNSGAMRLVTCWYPGDFAEAAALVRGSVPVSGAVVRHLEAAIGRAAAVVRESVGARLATDDECRRLALPHPAAVLVVYRIGLDALGVALEYRESVHPPGRPIMEHEYPASSAADFRR
ncbi:GntR family transcriptional regulator [Nocardia araoensis]|uniref:GntR family transcriptional regulator n=1 Tax=Nocardia araoensis TaxID=228600 RepID=UPI0002D2DF22|nr:GntR family transcriptional regulator [Nocardia araoensis]